MEEAPFIVVAVSFVVWMLSPFVLIPVCISLRCRNKKLDKMIADGFYEEVSNMKNNASTPAPPPDNTRADAAAGNNEPPAPLLTAGGENTDDAVVVEVRSAADIPPSLHTAPDADEAAVMEVKNAADIPPSPRAAPDAAPADNLRTPSPPKDVKTFDDIFTVPWPTAGDDTLGGPKGRIAYTLIGAALCVAVLYSVCFTGAKIYPLLSLPVFCAGALAALYFTLSKTGLLANKAAFAWAVPIMIVSSLNAVFEMSYYTYLNVAAVHLLFAALTFAAVKSKGARLNLSDMGGWFDLFDVARPSEKFTTAVVRAAWRTASDPSKKDAKKKRVALRILSGALLALPLLIVITLLLMRADAVFDRLLQKTFSHVADFFKVDIFWHIVAVSLAAAYLTGYIVKARELSPSSARLPEARADTVIAAAFLTPVNMLFAVFCLIQTAFLFSGGYMRLPEGLVYSAYAREGFFQLLFVAVINFGVLAVFLKIFPSCLQNRLLKILLVTLLAFTGILIASSYYRMSLYIGAYGYSRLRVEVITFLTLLSVLLIVTLWYIIKPKFDFLKSYIYIGMVFYMAVNVTSSASVVGRLNVNRFYDGAAIDLVMLSESLETAGLVLEVYEYEGKDTRERLPDYKDHSVSYRLERLEKERDGGWQNITVSGYRGKKDVARLRRMFE